MATLATYIVQIRTVIEALSPASATPSTAYDATDGLMPPADEPLTRDRLFEVELLDVGEIQAQWGSNAVQRKGRLDVVVHYDNLADRNTAFERISNDLAQITAALEQRSNYSADVHRVTYLGGGGIEQSDGAGWVARVPLEVLYQDAL